MLTEQEAEALDAWAWRRAMERAWLYTDWKGYNYKRRNPEEHYLWRYLTTLDIQPRWYARALWPYLGTRAAKEDARRLNNRAAQNPAHLMAQKVTAKIEAAKTELGLGPMQKLVQELKAGDWTTARKLYRADMLRPADLVGMTQEPMHRNTIRKRLIHERED